MFFQRIKRFLPGGISLIVMSLFIATTLGATATMLEDAQLTTATNGKTVFNANDFLLPQEAQNTKEAAVHRFLDTLQFEALIKRTVALSQGNPNSPISRALADYLTAVPTEQRTAFVGKVTASLQSPESLKTIRTTCAAIVEQNLDQESIEALTLFFSQHQASYFIRFQQALATATAAYILQQNTSTSVVNTSSSAAHQQAAQTFLSNLLALRKSENQQLLEMINTANLIAHVTPLCCNYLSCSYLQDLTAFLQTPAGRRAMIRYEQIEHALHDALIAWCTVIIQTINNKALACMCSVTSTQTNATSLLNEVKAQYNSIMDQVEEKIRYLCSALEKLYLRRFSQNNRTAFKKLASIAGETIDQCMHEVSTAANKTTTNLQTTSANIKQQDYQALKQFVKSECEKTVHEISTTASYSQWSPKNQSLEDLFELSKFNTLKMLISLIVIHANPDKDLKKEDLELKITRLMKQLIATNLTDSEIAELKGFFQSAAFQRILQHTEDFMQILLANLTPAVAEQLQRIFPWHAIL